MWYGLPGIKKGAGIANRGNADIANSRRRRWMTQHKKYAHRFSQRPEPEPSVKASVLNRSHLMQAFDLVSLTKSNHVIIDQEIGVNERSTRFLTQAIIFYKRF
jgi:hypothetical protein